MYMYMYVYEYFWGKIRTRYTLIYKIDLRYIKL